MIDLHAHILPGVDDGPDTLDIALEMLRVAARDGITTVAATSHWCWNENALTVPSALERTERVRQAAKEAGIPVEVVPGAEVPADDETVFAALRGLLMTYANNGRYLLLEFPFHDLPPLADQTIEQLLAGGFVPVVAHPERNAVLRQQPRRLQEWMRRGALSQLTGSSLTGRFGPEVQKAACRMLSEGLASVLASDGHSPQRRPPVLSEAVSVAEKLIGREKTLEMVKELPTIILEGGIVRSEAGPAVERPRRFWQRWFGPRE
ncbi:MAG: capsular biosynthesis protein [Armatimonadetes bacterium]|nr:capsular biosynthesis protein [Armatimonadota bacterium]